MPRSLLAIYTAVLILLSVAATAGTIRVERSGVVSTVFFDRVQPIRVERAPGTNAISVSLSNTLDPKALPELNNQDQIAKILRVSDDELRINLGCDCVWTSTTQDAAGQIRIVPRNINAQNEAPLKFDTQPTRRIPEIARAQLEYSIDGTKPQPENAPGIADDADLAVLINPASRARSSDFLETRLLTHLEQRDPTPEDIPEGIQQLVGSDGNQIVFRSDVATQSRALPEIEDKALEIAQSCDAFDMLVPSNWPDASLAKVQISSARRALGVLDGDINPAPGLQLVKAYLSLGMGAEASQSLGVAALTPDMRDILMAIAQVLDGADIAIGINADLAAQCANTALWHFLQSNDAPDELAEKARAQFSQAPVGVQSAIGARLARQFLARGFHDATRFVLDTLDGAPEQRSGERALIASQLAREFGFEREEKELLAQIVQTDADAAPDALLAMVNETLQAGDPAEEQDLETIQTLREENTGSETAVALLRAELQSAINGSDFSLVFKMLPEYEALSRNTQFEMELDRLGAKIVGLDSDAAFLTTAMAVPNRYYRRLPEPLQNKIADRFDTIGLGQLAQDLGSLANRPDIEQRNDPSRVAPSVLTAGAPEIAEQAPDPAAQPEGPSEVTGDGPEPILGTGQQNGEPSPSPVANQGTANAVRPNPNPTENRPIAQAVSNGANVLDQVDALRAELSEVGL